MKIKGLVIALISGLLMFGTQVNAASLPDEQWRVPFKSDINWQSDNFKSIAIADIPNLSETFSHLWAESFYQDGTWSRYTCNNTTQLGCTSPNWYSYQSVLPVCVNNSDTNCIESLKSIDSAGTYSSAKFVKYNVDKHPGNFVTPAALDIPNNSNPSIWELASAPHANGSTYAVIANLKGSISGKGTGEMQSPETISAFVIPVSIHKNALTRIPSCWYRQGVDLNNLRGNDSYCTGNEGEYTSATEGRCNLAAGTSGDCYAPEPFPQGIKFELKLRLKKEPLGWIHGRISDPTIAMDKDSFGNSVMTVAASPVNVPVLFTDGTWVTLSDTLKNWWLQEFPKYAVSPESAGTASGSNPENPGANISNSIIFFTPHTYGDFPMSMISALSGEVKDTAKVAPSAWSFKSLDNRWGNSVNPCITDGAGLKGIVTTNSTTYSAGAPVFDNGNLSYKVASLHYLPDGSVFRGSYNLVLRSDVARCLYKFSNAPISATISVLSQDGSPQVTSTSVSEKNGWLYLAANGFTFSSPTVNIKLTQDAPVATPVVAPTVAPATAPVVKPTSKQITITCVKGKTSKKVTAVKPTCPSGFKKK